MLDETLVLFGSEFGRQPTAQGQDGRDHNITGYPMWLAGAGVKKGFSYGATDEFGIHAVEGRMHTNDLHATLLALMGLDHRAADLPLRRPRLPPDRRGGRCRERDLRMRPAGETGPRQQWLATAEPQNMIDCKLIAITSDVRFLDLLERRLEGHEDQARRIPVAGTIAEACALLEKARPRLIVVHWGRGGGYQALNQLLWRTTVLAHPIPVLVFADWYRVEQATQLYRMGVTEYLSRTRHAHQFGRILDLYIRRGR